MGCFIVPATEAVVTVIATKVVKSKEKKISLSKKLGWLNKLLAGGSLLLAFEHVWHGEVSFQFPFLTAMASPEDTAEMIHEMSTVGVTMAAVCTLVWLGMVAVSEIVVRREAKIQTQKEENL